MYLLRSSAEAQRGLWDMINVGGVSLMALGSDDCPRMRELMWKYRDLPMDLADAALVRVAERERIRRIFTIDRRDFEVYRPQRLGRFNILP
jgi:predicted nucleic acid-binding protein